MNKLAFFQCQKCGNIVTKLVDAGPKVACCGEPMAELEPNTVDAAVEKHVPVIAVDGSTVTVTVGEVEHPMADDHYIAWICLHTKNSIQYRTLQPGDAPRAVFELADDEAIEAFAYCNKHGLWKAEV